MIAGRLDRRITIERYSSTINDLGEEVGTWAPLATVWAAKSDIRDSERFVAQQVNSTITTRFQIRWLSKIADVNAKDRLSHGGRLYGIVAVKEIGRREGLEITAAARSDVVLADPAPVFVRTDSRVVVTTPINHPVTVEP
jgi:SPP1 family predicted phage head-tail adaptor